MDPELIIIFGAMIFLFVGWKLWQKGSDLLIHGKKSKAVVFKNNYKAIGSEPGMYYPVVRFLTDDKEWITQELDIGQSPAKPEGTKLEVIYDPDDPTIVEINSSFRLEILPRLLVAIGCTGVVLGLLSYLDIIEF